MTHRLCRLSAACATLILSLLVPAVSRADNVTIDATTSLTFSPANRTINVGDTVTWRNVGGGTHNVMSDDAHFRCANGCDDTGGNGNVSSGNWTFTRTFNTAGTFVYYCAQHGGPTFGMKGTITVEGSEPPPPQQNGTLKFTQANYSVSEAVGNATITVSRVSGSDGAVAVNYAASAGSAGAPGDFTAASGTLSWAAGDAANKTFAVTIVNDTTQEPNETVLLALTNPTGGAVLDAARKTATLTIADNDAPAGGTPAPPTNLQVTSTGTSEVGLSWHDDSNNETEFRIEQKLLGGTYAQVGTVGANVTTFTAEGLDEAKLYSFRVRAAGSGGATSAFSNEVSAATDTTPAPCVASASALCLNGGRFKAQVSWRTADTSGNGSAVPIPSAPDSGLFFFFNSSNIEMLIKALNACAVNSRYWIFYAATTNVEFTLTVTDTQSGKVKIYFNPLNSAAAPIQDVSAFATCP